MKKAEEDGIKETEVTEWAISVCDDESKTALSRISEIVTDLRCNRNHTVEEFANLVGVSVDSLLKLSRCELGLTTTDLWKIAKFFKLDYISFLGGFKKDMKIDCFSCIRKDHCIGYRLVLDLDFLLVSWAPEEEGPKLEEEVKDRLYEFVAKHCFSYEEVPY